MSRASRYDWTALDPKIRAWVERRGRTDLAALAVECGTSVRAIERRLRSHHRDVTVPLPSPPPPPLDPTDERLRSLELRLTRTQDQLREANAKLRTTDRQSGVVLELAEVLRQHVRPLTLPAGWATASRRQGKEQEEVDAVVMLSDQHADRVVEHAGTWGLEQYDFLAFRCRLFEWAKTTARYCSVHLPRYRFHTLWVWHLGDAVNGDIHNMKLKNQWANSLRAALAVGEAQAQALAWLAPHFERVVVVCVPGNHGRTTQKIEYEDPYDNFDYLVARTMQLQLQGTALEGRVQIEIPRAWSAHVEVRGKLWHLNHGNGVIGTWGIPWYGFERREGRVQRLVATQGRQVDYFAYGHYHTPLTRPAGLGKAIHAGAWYYTDEATLGRLSAGNEPEQQLLVFSERFGRQIEVPLMVRDREHEAKARAGDWDPLFGRGLLDDLQVGGAVGTMPLVR